MKKTALRITQATAAAALVCLGLALSCTDDGVDGDRQEVESFLDMFAGWGKQPKLTVNVISGGSVGGEVSVSPKSADNTYKPKTKVTATAEEFEEFRFLGWTGAVNDSSASVTVTMNRNATLNANFLSRNIPAFPLMVNVKLLPETGAPTPAGVGAISRLPNFTVYPAGDTVTVKAAAEKGYRFIGWSGAVNDTAASLKIVTANDTLKLTANFISASATAYSLDAQSDPPGSGAITRNPNWIVYLPNDIVLVKTRANAGYTFTGWTGAATGAADSVWVTMDGNKKLTAKYQGSGTGGGEVVKGTLTDSRDGQLYKTVTIGKYTWMAENLNYETDSSWCYNNSPDSCAKYGRLYKWGAAIGLPHYIGNGYYVSEHTIRDSGIISIGVVQGVCPSDWHLPNMREWEDLVTFAGGMGRDDGEGAAGIKLKSSDYWWRPNIDWKYRGTDDYGFSAMPGGERRSNGTFEGNGGYGWWWGVRYGDDFIINRRQEMMYDSPDMFSSENSESPSSSVRCVADAGKIFPLTVNASPRNTGSGRFAVGDTVKIFDGETPNDKAFRYWEVTSGGPVSFVNTDASQRQTFFIMPANAVTMTAVYAGYVEPSTVVKGSFTDARDGQTYKTVKIGFQTWMAENLNYEVEDSWCESDNPDNCTEYGRLYKWAAAMNLDASYNSKVWDTGNNAQERPVGVRGVCPAGWHLPSKREWGYLAIAAGGLGSNDGGSGTAAKALKSTSGWYNNGNGTDEYGFTALPGGNQLPYYQSGAWNIGLGGTWWTATEKDGDVYVRRTNYFSDNLQIEWAGISKRYGYSVRCVADER